MDGEHSEKVEAVKQTLPPIKEGAGEDYEGDIKSNEQKKKVKIKDHESPSSPKDPRPPKADWPKLKSGGRLYSPRRFVRRTKSHGDCETKDYRSLGDPSDAAVYASSSQVITANDLNLNLKKRNTLTILHRHINGKKLKVIGNRFEGLRNLYALYTKGMDLTYLGSDDIWSENFCPVIRDTQDKPQQDGIQQDTDPKSNVIVSDIASGKGVDLKQEDAATVATVATVTGGSEEKKGDSVPVPSAEAPLEKKENTVTSFHAFFVAVKAFVGTGILFLPKGMLNGGLIFSIVLLTVVAIGTLHCMILLAETNALHRGKSYGQIAKLLYGRRMEIPVLVSICLSQAGFCGAYYIFVGQNIKEFILQVTDCRVRLHDSLFIFGQLLFTIPLCLIRNLSGFSVTSVVGDVIIITSLAYIIWFSLSTIYNKGPAIELSYVNLDKFTFFVGAAMFSFEGIALVTPMAESMKDPSQLGRTLKLCIIFVLGIFLFVGISGYFAFGNKLETNIVLNLPRNLPSMTLKLAYSTAVILSFPLLLHPCTAIIEKSIFKKARGGLSKTVKWNKNILRTMEVSILALLSYLSSKNLDKVVSLIGCFACIPIAFIYPAMFHAKIATSKKAIIKDWILVAVGVIVMAYTTYITIYNVFTDEFDVPASLCKE